MELNSSVLVKFPNRTCYYGWLVSIDHTSEPAIASIRAKIKYNTHTFTECDKVIQAPVGYLSEINSFPPPTKKKVKPTKKS